MRRNPVAVALVALVFAGACTGGATKTQLTRGTTPASPETAPTTISTPAPSTSASTARAATRAPAAPVAAKPPPPPPPGLGPGASGPAVLDLEQKLAAHHYDPGPVDGKFDTNTGYAVTAFQKVAGMARTGRATDDVIARLTNDPPATPPLVPGGGATRVEIDLPRQVLFLYQHDALDRILTVSTGSSERYCVDGECDRAITPGGSFKISSRIHGWHTSRLGKLYNPLFFNGGIAIHGATAVPPYPASHGCVRIPLAAAEWFPGVAPNGTPVYVAGGQQAPVPFNEPAPGQAPPPPPPTTTTTTVAPPPPPTTTTTTPSPAP